MLPTPAKTSQPTQKMPKITKRQIVAQVSKATGLNQNDVMDVVQKTLETIINAVADGKNIELRNFGVFEVKLTKTRVGRNPNAPKNQVIIPPRATVKFKPGKEMRQRVLLLTEELKSSKG